MTRFSHILLDLDGTVTNPKEGITRAAAKGLDHFSIPYASLDSLCCFIGPPLEASFMEFGKLSKADAHIAIAKFREYYADKGIFECSLYDGIPHLLQSIKAADKKLFLATSKVRTYAVEILKHFDLLSYFDFISGSEFDGTRVIKGEVIAYALEQTQTKASTDVVMVGDRKHDIIGAKSAGLYSVGILYGYGSKEELESENPHIIIPSVKELEPYLLS